MPRKQPGPPCSVCRQPSVAKGLCDKHYRRWKHLGDTNATLRPDDWGRREKHPLYGQWTWAGRRGRDDCWKDFWAFVRDVGERPSERHRLKRIDARQPFGPANFYWHEQTITNECTKAYQRDWRAKNRLRSKHHSLKKSYGITLEQFDAMLEAQGGKCAICGGEGGGGFNTLCVDHCHNSKKVRGLLCSNCNRALGLFNDEVSRLLSAVAYLENAAEGRTPEPC